MTPLLTAARSAVYRAPAHLEAVRHSVGEYALWIDIDLTPVSSKRELLDEFAKALSLSRTFGHNWDALADVLQDLSTRPAGAWVLHLTHASHAASVLGVEWATLLDVLSETASYWKASGKAFVVFVEGVAELPPWI